MAMTTVLDSGPRTTLELRRSGRRRIVGWRAATAVLGRLGLAAVIAIALTFFLLPLVSLFLQMSPGALIGHLHGPVVSQALVVSLETSLAALGVVILIGTPLAHWLARISFRGKRIVEVAVMLPIVCPPAVAGVALLLVFGRAGMLGHELDLAGVHVAFSKLAVVIALVFVAGPFYVISAQRAIADVDADLLAVSRTLGLGPWRTFWATEAPLALPGLLSGATLALARTLGEFGATLVFAGNLPGVTQTFSLGIYTVLQADQNVAVAMSALLMAFAFALLIVFSLVDRRARVTVLR
jgi:molybdate transport system permease protein